MADPNPNRSPSPSPHPSPRQARSFANLGGDATLVAPCAMAAAPAAQYAHLGSFVRGAAAAQQAEAARAEGVRLQREAALREAEEARPD